MLQSVKIFISYWYFRYLLVTELYMVEKWERIFIHIFFLVFFSALSYFNSAFILNLIKICTNSLFANEERGRTGHLLMEGSPHSATIFDEL